MQGSTVRVAVEFRARMSHPLRRDEFHAEGERVMAELLKLEDSGFADAAVSTDHAGGTMTLEGLFQLEGDVDVMEKPLAIFRCALHATGGHTPDWPGGDDLEVQDERTFYLPDSRASTSSPPDPSGIGCVAREAKIDPHDSDPGVPAPGVTCRT